MSAKIFVLRNDHLTVTIDSKGAELTSIKFNKTGVEYLWDGNEKFWKRHACILFPFVGMPFKQQYKHEGKVYKMGQHGFARDKVFEIVESNDTVFHGKLVSDDSTLQIYPFKFILELKYVLKDASIECTWIVTNPDTKELIFSIGGHPAFFCPLNGEGKKNQYYIGFDTADPNYTTVTDDGYSLSGVHTLKLDNDKFFQIKDDMFDKVPTYIFDSKNIKKVMLATPDKKPYVSLTFDMPLLGIWSPSPDCPFMCLEPWFGRCDDNNYSGELKDKPFVNKLEKGNVFSTTYTISILN